VKKVEGGSERYIKKLKEEKKENNNEMKYYEKY
jgi:hypothetical protein